MWFLLPYLALFLVVVVTIFLYIYFLRPGILARLLLSFFRFRSGMQVKFIGDGDTLFCYGERGIKSPDRTSILFIHGFTASKDQWNTAFKYLPKHYHLVAMDMPGHGLSYTPPESQDLSLDFGMNSIRRFAELVGLTERPFHVVGASLGGCLAGLFAAEFPQLVERVTMICPAMQCPVDSEFSEQVQKALNMGREEIDLHHCSLLPQSPQDMQAMLDSCVYSKVKVAHQMLKGFMELRAPKNPYFLKVFRALATEENVQLLENRCHLITMPSQLIWGEHDQIIHPSGAEVLRKRLPACEDVTLLERCGHSVDMDRPLACCSAILRFRGDKPPKEHNSSSSSTSTKSHLS